MDDHPAIATELLFDGYRGQIARYPDFWAITAPDAPDDYFGNYLLLATPPHDHDKGWLEQSFDRHIGRDPRIRHRTFQWTLQEGQHSRLAGFITSGYHYLELQALCVTATQLRQPAGKQPLPVRPFVHHDWHAWHALELAERDPAHNAVDYARFLNGRMALYHAMIADGLGQWWGMWEGEELVASCGLFFKGSLGRFQWVRTRERWRNRGLCRHLLYQVASHGLQRVPEIIIVADSDYFAHRIYRNLGFETRGRLGSLFRRKRPEP